MPLGRGTRWLRKVCEESCIPFEPPEFYTICISKTNRLEYAKKRGETVKHGMVVQSLYKDLLVCQMDGRNVKGNTASFYYISKF